MVHEQACAPVALFVHRRADHTREVVRSLQANAEAPRTRLYVFADGARRASDDAGVAEVRSYARSISGFASVTVVERDRNLGLAASIIAGVTAVLEDHEAVIVLEDDTVVGPYFLRFMNDGLACYRDDDLVASIHAYVYPVGVELPETFFLRGADCWGWATWRRAWRHFDADGAALLRRLQDSGEVHVWDHDGTSGLLEMLEGQVAGDVDSWAVRWTASTFLDGMYTLYPGRSLVHNIGNDGSGRHGGLSRRYDVDLCRERIPVTRMPIEESAVAYQAFTDFYTSTGSRGPLTALLRRLAKGLSAEQRVTVLRLLPTSVRARLR